MSRPWPGPAWWLLPALLLTACSPEPESPTPTASDAAPSEAMASLAGQACSFPGAPGTTAPDWLCTPPPAEAAQAVGSAPRSGAGLAFSRSMALADARTRLARKLAGPDATTVSADLSGSRVLAAATGPDGRVYVLVGFE